MIKDEAFAVELYRMMVLIRQFEEAVDKHFAEGLIPGMVHLYAGEEAIAAGVVSQMDERDWLTSTHRGHGHCIARGVDLRPMAAELYGRKQGLCGGKGGSMHVADVNRGILGANAIVGGGAPLAAGAGLTAKTLGTGGVSVCFFGDGATAEGSVHEAMNLASVLQLPVVFVCENNGFAEATLTRAHFPLPDIAVRAAGYGMPGVTLDGFDVEAVVEAAGEAVERARSGGGPSFIEAKAWRYYGHYQGDQTPYRTAEEVAEYRSRDPITRWGAELVKRGMASDASLAEVTAGCADQVSDAFAYANTCEWPDVEDLAKDVYVSYEAGSVA